MKKRKKIILIISVIIIIAATVLLPIRPQNITKETKYCSEKGCKNQTGFCSKEGYVCGNDMKPVCGLNNVTYSNSCHACNDGQDYTEGECSEKRNTSLLNLIKNKPSN